MCLGGARQCWLAPQHGKNGDIASGMKMGCVSLMLLLTVPAAAVVKHQ
jgi:hypothetical protein